MANEMIVFDSLARSNISHQDKSMIRQWADAMTGGAASRFMKHQQQEHGITAVETFVHVLRQTLEQPAMGAFLGVLAAKKCLDYKGVPGDFAAGLTFTGIGMAAALSGRGYGLDLVNLGTSGFTTYAFRKTFGFFASAGASMAGEWDADTGNDSNTATDPIVDAAKNL